MQRQARPIIIFDSGVGGLSIYQEVKKLLPGITVIYCSDSAGFPYGPRSEEEVVNRTSYYLRELTKRYNPALAIIACNTASTISLPRVRQELNIPVVGVVPAIKTASEMSRNRCIGLLATPGTVSREYTDRLIEDFASDCKVIRVGSSELVYMAEHYLRTEQVDLKALENIIAPFFAEAVAPDAIVLGCTHFPLLKDLLQSVAPVSVHWIDSGEAIARRVRSLLGEFPQHSGSREESLFVYTGEEGETSSLVPAIKGMGFAGPVFL